MFCPKCGKQIDNNELYCIYCGTKMRKEESGGRYESQGSFPIFSTEKIIVGIVCITIIAAIWGLTNTMRKWDAKQLFVGLWVKGAEYDEEGIDERLIIFKDGTCRIDETPGTYEIQGDHVHFYYEDWMAGSLEKEFDYTFKEDGSRLILDDINDDGTPMEYVKMGVMDERF